MFYIIRGEAYRSKGNSENSIKIYEEFKDDILINAREKAFKFYQNYIDVFLESKGKKYISHEQSEIDLQDFFNSFQKKISHWGEVDSDFGVCIQISFVFNDTVVHTFKNGIISYKGEEVIHGIDKKNENLNEIYFKNLITEYSIYKKYSYEMKKLSIGIDVSGPFEDKVIEYIIETPIDFNKLFNN